jgi:hypothetical protein
MSSDYKLTMFEKGDFTDNFGNYWCSATFEDDAGDIHDHVRWVVKDPMEVKVNDTFYGHFEEKESKIGNKYMRFYRDKKDDQPSLPQQGLDPSKSVPQKDQYWDDKNAQIRAQWAIGQAVSAFDEDTTATNYLTNVETLAKDLFAMVDRVKGSSESTDLSGYDKFKASRPTKDDVPEPSDEEMASLATSLDQGVPIDMSTIPF